MITKELSGIEEGREKAAELVPKASSKKTQAITEQLKCVSEWMMRSGTCFTVVSFRYSDSSSGNPGYLLNLHYKKTPGRRL